MFIFYPFFFIGRLNGAADETNTVSARYSQAGEYKETRGLEEDSATRVEFLVPTRSSGENR